MRHWCGQVGLKLSEKALAPATREERGCYVDGTYSTNTTSVGNALPVGAERDVFDLLGLVYASSGFLKLRCSGLRWARGSNLRALG